MLATILAKLIDHAAALPTQPMTHRFTNSLRISITYYEEAHQFNLILARDKVHPSLTEWKTVLKNWPYPVHANPQTGDQDGRHYLIAMLPAHPKLF